MNNKQMLLGVMLGDSYGVHPGAWRMPGVDVTAHTNFDLQVEYAQIAEGGGFQFAFLPDRVFLRSDLSAGPPGFSIDPILALTALARGTTRLGLVGSASTSLNEPYNLARQLKALDVISRGRAGWNAIPTYEPEAFANFGKQLPPREHKYERLHEVIQIVQALWGSWGHEAGEPDQAGMFANPAHVRPINMQGRHVGARGPLPIPPSQQGQPVIFQPASSGYGLQAAGMYADAVVGMPMTIKDSRAQRETIRQAAADAGRNPDDVKYVPFAMFGLGATVRDALDRRRAMDGKVDQGERLAHLGAVLGMRLDPQRSDDPLTEEQLSAARSNRLDPRSARTLKLARQGWSPRDLIAHGVLDPSPGVVGTPVQAADFLEEWFDADAVDGFIILIDNYRDGIAAFVNEVVPILQERGRFPTGFEGTTLRENLGLPAQYGVNQRLIQDH
ncbi:NtaA/DmoA family FMN-dependent monooxygenase [Williamsia sp. D3]|uniref:NtaA/DmoA family FMN-dependent monooxygenase n=1 Tax=Williamsia sp. D3 TaxID=1313067 RepID=UPI0003D3923B|nr:NtaA/DmoA family FMN-dependent monooxygenase [Williamsia sp. D3]ETD33284.1 nitrilotriacetate monooxygenase [Williamsia sp. D3]